MERNTNKNTVEMNTGQSKGNSKNKKSNPTAQIETKERRLFSCDQKSSLVSSPAIEMSSGAHNETETFFTTTRSSFQHSSPSSKTRRISSSEASSSHEEPYSISQDCSFFPNYMANTKSWKAKARSQSAPRQRNEFVDSKQSGKQRVSVDGRNSISRAVWASPMISSTVAKEKTPWSEEFERLVSNIDYYRFITA